MSAMHWEARRRQSALDRRMARDQQQDSGNSLQSAYRAKASVDDAVNMELRYILQHLDSPGSDLVQRGFESSHNATDSNTTQGQTDGGQCPHCKGDLKTPVYHSARIPNRYSSLQYTQQW